MKTLMMMCLLLATAAPASAACRWDFDCSSSPCRQVQLCDSTIDLPAIRPPAIPPIAMPSIKPIAPIGLPPLGTRSCQQKYICAGGGCSWQSVCQ